MSNIKTWRSALGGDADTTTSSNAQHDQLNQSDTDEQHRKRHGIVFEPMPIIVHLVHPYSNAFGNRLVDQHPPHTCFRRISPQRFLVSRFVAKTWPAFRSSWQESGRAVPSRGAR